MAEKQILALSGKSRGVLRLEYGGQLGFSVESPAYLRDAELWLLFSDEEWSILPGCQGECALPPRRVRAAAVARNGAFVMTGGRADFTKAKSACFTRQEKARLKALEVQAVARAPTQRAVQAASEQAAGQEQIAGQEQSAAQERGQKQVRTAWENRQEQIAGREQSAAQEREQKQVRTAGERAEEQAWAEAQKGQMRATMHNEEAGHGAQEERIAARRAEKQAATVQNGQAQIVWKKAGVPRHAEPMGAQAEREAETFSWPVPEIVSAPALRELRRAAEPGRPGESKEKEPDVRAEREREQPRMRRQEHAGDSPAEPGRPEESKEKEPDVRAEREREQPRIRRQEHAEDSPADPKERRQERAGNNPVEPKVRWQERAEISAESMERPPAEAQNEQLENPPSARRDLFPALEETALEEPQKSRPQRAAESREEAPRAPRCFERKESEVAPFPKIFPSSHWKKIEYPAYPGRGHYLMGEIYQGQACTAKALAVPGRYALNPPAWLKGFETYLEDSEGQGYWLLFQDGTGKALPIAQVFRDLREEC